MKHLILMFALMLGWSGIAAGQTADLFFSEYVEGSGYNKALEIHNGTGDPIELGSCAVAQYSNGSFTPQLIALDPVTLQPGDAFVLANSSSSAGLLAVADQTSSELNFNGNDAVVLVRGLQVIDSIGQIGVDPGSAWVCDLGSTINATLRRTLSFCQGDGNAEDAFNPCLTFEFFPVDSFDGLGSHSDDCTSVGTGQVSWGSLKAVYR